MYTVGRRPGWMGQLKPTGAHMMTTQAPDDEHQTVGFGVFSAGFWVCCGPILLCPHSILE